jgi:hypothetical protein
MSHHRLASLSRDRAREARAGWFPRWLPIIAQEAKNPAMPGSSHGGRLCVLQAGTVCRFAAFAAGWVGAVEGMAAAGVFRSALAVTFLRSASKARARKYWLSNS